jgi:hypothetical protein
MFRFPWNIKTVKECNFDRQFLFDEYVAIYYIVLIAFDATKIRRIKQATYKTCRANTQSKHEQCIFIPVL